MSVSLIPNNPGEFIFLTKSYYRKIADFEILGHSEIFRPKLSVVNIYRIVSSLTLKFWDIHKVLNV